MVIDNQSDNNGFIYLEINAADDSDQAAFFFYVEEADEDIVIPAGVYPIDYSEEYGTVAANQGVQGNGVWPSYYARKAEGGFAVPLWLLVDGTVEVTKTEDGYPYLEVNAVNSYGVEVHIVYDGTPVGSGVENTELPTENACKVLRNGQLVIIRDGKIFNVVGAEL